jgi:hypothetical protein
MPQSDSKTQMHRFIEEVRERANKKRRKIVIKIANKCK